MKNRLFKGMMMLSATIFTFFAFATSASACAWASYQPEEPECLREK